MLLCTFSREYQLSDFSKRCICVMQRRFPKGNVKLCLQEMMARIAGNTPHVENESSISLSLESQISLPLFPSLTTQERHKTRGSKHQCGQSVLQSGNVDLEELYCRFHLHLPTSLI